MSTGRTSAKDGISKTPKRNLPAWMSTDDGEKSGGKKSDDGRLIEDDQENSSNKKAKGHSRVKNNAEETEGSSSSGVGASANDFSRLLEGVVFALSGFVNPERSILRSKALQMGAEYERDWNSNCTLLICAYHNTPKFRQVEAENGTIVSKEWILECHTQKQLVEIDSYLMHAGKPWRKGNVSQKHVQDMELAPPKKAQKQENQENRLSQMKPDAAVQPKATSGESSKSVAGDFSPSKVKNWAISDLNKTVSWLESQEEKPDPSDIKKVAAEGILTCLQDSIDFLDKRQELQSLAEQWNFLPRVVEELVKSESKGNSSGSVSKEDILTHAVSCMKIYQRELNKVLGESVGENKNQSQGENRNGKAKQSETATEYDSDETIEMTENEIDLAFKTIASKAHNC